MRYLGLDVGNKRVGVAVGNNELRLATPLGVIQRGTLEQDATKLRAYIDEYDAEKLVCGLPRNADNTSGEQETLTRTYVEQLAAAVGITFCFQDERYSTATALAQQRARGLDEKRGRATVDASAAAVILQDFLDSLRETQ